VKLVLIAQSDCTCCKSGSENFVTIFKINFWNITIFTWDIPASNVIGHGVDDHGSFLDMAMDFYVHCARDSFAIWTSVLAWSSDTICGRSYHPCPMHDLVA
jgi:hypothetical protein